MSKQDDRPDPRAIIATAILQKTWDWDEVVPVYIPKKLHGELMRMTQRIARDMPGIKNGPADPGNAQHFVAMAIAYQMGQATLHLIERNPVVKLISALGEVLHDILGGGVLDGVGDCSKCSLADKCPGSKGDGDCSQCSSDEHQAETSPLN